MKKIVIGLVLLCVCVCWVSCRNGQPAFDPTSQFQWAKRVLSPADPAVDWDGVPDHLQVYVRGLLEIREAYPQLLQSNDRGVNLRWRALPDNTGDTRGYCLNFEDEAEKDQRLLVLANLREEAYRFTIPSGYYDVLAYGNRAGNHSFGNVSGIWVQVPPKSLTILVSR